MKSKKELQEDLHETEMRLQSVQHRLHLCARDTEEWRRLKYQETELIEDIIDLRALIDDIS